MGEGIAVIRIKRSTKGNKHMMIENNADRSMFCVSQVQKDILGEKDWVFLLDFFLGREIGIECEEVVKERKVEKGLRYLGLRPLIGIIFRCKGPRHR